MNKLSIYNSLLLEMRRDAVISVLGTDDGNKLLSFTQDDSYHHLVVNTAKNGEGHSVDELLDQDLFRRFRDLGISTAWGTNKTLTAETAGASVTLDKQTSGYNDFVRFIEIKSGLTTKTPLLIDLIDQNYERSNKHFDVLINDSEWYIAYPKTQLGSMALGRSYWDRKEDKLKYDQTFDKGEGDYTGEMNWCTVINGSNNRFIAYHMNKKLHMFYCISKRFGVEDNKRKLCLSLTKVKEEVKFSEGHASVDANNYSKDEEFFRTTLDSRYDELIKHTKDNLEEIDEVAYYSNYNLVQYNAAFENPRIEVDIKEAENELKLMLKHTKHEKIFEAMFNSDRNREKKHQLLAESEKTPLEILNKLAESGNIELQIAVAQNKSCYPKILHYLASTGNFDIQKAVANNRNTTAEILHYLASTGNFDIQQYVAENSNTPAEILHYLASTGNFDIQKSVAYNKNTTSEILDYLLRTSYSGIKEYVANNPNISSKTLDYLVAEGDLNILLSIANNYGVHKDILDYLSSIDNDYVKESVAGNPNTSYETLHYLSSIDSDYVKQALLDNPNCPEDLKNKLKDEGIVESYIKKYIQLLFN